MIQEHRVSNFESIGELIINTPVGKLKDKEEQILQIKGQIHALDYALDIEMFFRDSFIEEEEKNEEKT